MNYKIEKNKLNKWLKYIRIKKKYDKKNIIINI